MSCYTAYQILLLQEVKLVEVTSNIWGTKFKIHGLAKTVPANLGQVIYKTSLLHLQPRQMTLVITELSDDLPHRPDLNFNPNLFSDDEDENSIQAIMERYNNNQVVTSNLEAIQKCCEPIKKSFDTSDVKSLATKNSSNLLQGLTPFHAHPNRSLTRHKNVTKSCQTYNSGRSPLARAESYDDDSAGECSEESTNSITACILHNNYVSSKLSQSKNISMNYNRSNCGINGSSCSQSRQAISPLFNDSSVPTLQSPKSAVAPRDIIFERPAVTASGQTTLMSYSSNTDYGNNMMQVKNVLLSDTVRSTHSHVNPVPLNLNLNWENLKTESIVSRCKHPLPSTSKKAREILFIDDESTSPSQYSIQHQKPSTTLFTSPTLFPWHKSNSTSSSTTSGEGCASSNHHPAMKRTPTIVSIAPANSDFMPRSFSVGYLDSVTITPSEEALSALRRDAPHKRLILVDKQSKPQKERIIIKVIKSQ